MVVGAVSEAKWTVKGTNWIHFGFVNLLFPVDM